MFAAIITDAATVISPAASLRESDVFGFTWYHDAAVHTLSAAQAVGCDVTVGVADGDVNHCWAEPHNRPREWSHGNYIHGSHFHRKGVRACDVVTDGKGRGREWAITVRLILSPCVIEVLLALAQHSECITIWMHGTTMHITSEIKG